MASCDYSTKLEETIAWLDDWIGQLEEAIADPPSGEEAERANQEMAIVQKLRGSYVSTRDELLDIAAKRPPCPVTLEDIKHCKTQPEVLYAVAERHRGEVHLDEVAQLILGAKMSKAKKDSIRATLSHFVTDHDDWAHMSGGRARTLKFGPATNG